MSDAPLGPGRGERLSSQPFDTFSSGEQPLTPLQVQLYYENFPRVEVIAKRIVYDYASHPDELEEAILDGNLGLVKAIQGNFDPDKASETSTTHATYVSKHIAGQILRGMRERYGRENVTVEDESGALKTKTRIRKLKPSTMKAINTATSLDQPHHIDDTEATLYEHIPSHSARNPVEETVLARTELEDLLAQASPRDRRIFWLHVLEGRPQAEVAGYVGTTQVQVSRVTRRIVAGRYRAMAEAA